MDDNKSGNPDVPAVAAPKPEVKLEVTVAAKLNLADYQNSVPVLRELAVLNEPETELHELELSISSQPPFLRSKTWRMDTVAGGQRCRVSDLDIQLDGALFSRLTEAEPSVVLLTLRSLRQPDIELARKELPVELLARNQWGGLAHLPDMVAAFVQPNEPFIDRLLSQAAELLREAGKNPALNGYQGGAKHAWEIASALWASVGAMGLNYALPPASFEHTGQKVRSPGQVSDSGVATCLDLTLLFAAALEQAGLNPILVFTQGHSFVGVWLKKEEFTTTVVDDVTALRKRIRLKELIVFETTLATQRPLPPFSYAIDRGSSQLSEEQEQSFELCVDVRRARMQRIKPLASAEANGTVAGQPSQPAVARPTVEEAPDLPDEPDDGRDEVAPERPEDRLSRWQRKLLDLSLRNNLLSFKSTKRAVRLDAPDPGQVEDILAEGHSLKLLPRPDLMEGSDPRSQAIYEGRQLEDVRRERALDALQRKEVFVGLAEDEMETRLVELYRTARSTLQEGGSNTLYLALGFLSWTRDANDPKRYRAPLILIPVALDRRSVRSGFSLKLHDDEPRFNPTLIEMLRQDYDLRLDIGDTEIPKDDRGLDIAGIWKKVSSAVRDIKGWEVVDDVVLSTFSFAKYLMWKDLTERTEQLKENPVVRHLIETPREPYSSSIAFPNPKRLDAELPPQETFCPLPADSSQLAAVVAGSRGKDFVLIGPPGTGKSQTISNVIAQCLAENKRVLFVSEKMAALDVVYRRLKDVGLGEFCLELHSNKARKVEVLEQLKRSWDATGEVDPQKWKAEAERLGRLRADLNRYVERLHQRHSNGLSAYEAIGRVVAGKDVPQLGLSWPSVHAHDVATLEGLREVAELLDINAQAVGERNLTSSPLAHIVHTEWSPGWQATLLDAARHLVPAADGMDAAGRALETAIGLPMLDLTRRVRGGLAIMARILPQACGHDWRFALRPDAKAVSEAMQRGATLVASHRQLKANLPSPWAMRTMESLRTGVQMVTRSRELYAALAAPWTEALCSELRTAGEMLAKHKEYAGQLSLKYGEGVERLDLLRLQRELQSAEKAIWPLGWFKRRALAKTLKAVATPGGEPDISGDIRRLVKMKGLQSELTAKEELGAKTSKVWQGMQSDLAAVRATLTYQRALAKAHERQSWEDVGLDAVSEGRCGNAMAENLARMRELRRLDAEIERLTPLGADTQQVWAGHETDLTAAVVALTFQSALGAARDGKTWPDDEFGAVEEGRCGSTASGTLRNMRELRKLEQELDQLHDLEVKTGGLWSGLRTKLDEVEHATKFSASLATAIGSLVTMTEELTAIKAPIERLLAEGNMLLDPAGAIASSGQAYLGAWTGFQAAVERFSLASGLPPEDKSTLGDMAASALSKRCKEVLEHSGKVNAWCAWRKVRIQAIAMALAPLVAAIEQGVVVTKSVRHVFDTDYARWWLNAFVDGDEVLRTFVSAEHEKRIRDFKDLDDRFTDLTRAWVRAQLCADLPKQDSVSRNSEWGLLRYEMQKKRNHLPLRELLSRTPTAITKLTPCLLMSPLSVAQYLSAEASAFDVVVFDEASQIPVWDAVGAIARAKQVIMVGDPKQLPPTSFFDRAESDADDADVEVDLESILDECIGANLPTMNLSWHYRSRHESLIAFSNHRYYQGELVTFPSPVTEDKAVSFHYIRDGLYEKGGARTNKPEAKALVADLLARLRSPVFKDSGLTIGVVTFNSEQQRLIEDLLDEERRKDPSIEPYFMDSLLEPVFVKNLESVQGDERDVMYFSLTYGPSVGGTVSMNFGPMNKQGGERRLNVAITRARHELRVFSSLRPEQMDLSRTQAAGVRDLKHFMEFAERGARALGEAVAGSVGDFESPFEKAVAVALTELGWRLHPQVGVSAFRVDLGVVDEDAPGSYLAGVECDGATYHRSATARDRDKLREQVLRGLGWDIVRIWSTDWWVDATGTAEKIDAQLQALRERRRATRESEAELAEVARVEAEQAIAQAKVAAGTPVQPEPERAVPTASPEWPHQTQPQEEEVYARNASESPKTVGTFTEADLSMVQVKPNADTFFERSYDGALGTMIAYVVQQEGPIRDEVLARRIARAHGWLRTGGRIQERVVQLAARMHRSTTEDVGAFFWTQPVPSQTIAFRRPPAGTLRPVEDIAIEELAGLAGELRSAGMDAEAGVAAMAREIGLQRLRAASRERLEAAWRRAGGG
jgi:very-short-patch-repair endonuclease